MATLNDMVSRILTEMFRFNEFNNPPTGLDQRDRHHPGASGGLHRGRRGGHRAAEERPAARCRCARRERGTVAVIGPAASAAPTDTGGGSAYVTSHLQRHPAAGHPGRGRGRAPRCNYVQGLPTDTSLSPIPSRRPDPGLRVDRTTAAATPAR